MKQARVAFEGKIQQAWEDQGRVRLADGRHVDESEVVWLPPVVPGTILALGLNYADHAAEIASQTPEEPMVFLKGANTLVGHRAFTPRPADATVMHYECELAIVIGKPARRVPKASAYDYIAGYTVANDYAVRNYLEGFYRPNFRIKSRDDCTPLGPWLVDVADIPDPMNLRLTTRVNGETTQEGNTRDMIFDVPFLIEYFSAFMTLQPGDLILTGTPKGTVDVRPGDDVVTEIEGIGALHNTIIEGAKRAGAV
ncbi:5-oxopent-3-ene-1,2,5-tricarboxylate decarboxylase [Alloalcanivorax dieselolei B5]|uniref:5-oxopent-3-ene-1,2,5-tricarboxylate decarboxylase n=1 Tax=Alcanivorax dieselolei (strain DSM 16502 / CGMCC 1.3690 / MCCC 1A00001 / B-5) TaxID=930169 RepID=K0C812_ALCDB|nr:fumarylacetoacetate hydrolase family protein [Alloalcanivorax dieselolei]AFT69644.1 5-oxopent-3-ene-1,2,5-tricarboxylate decarboxylase [Alloalcanivorax dieselolei B5]GGK03477.1 fumarylacetoacetate (FAA) hydrolase [Alloalcanivorax dieselolei]